MKTTGKHRVIARTARPSIPLAGLLLTFMVVAVPGKVHARPNATGSQPRPEDPKTAAPPQAAPRGQREGIKVHGHWIIEVRNPDGSVEAHVEFENGICPSQTGPTLAGQTVTWPGGAFWFSQVATGQIVPGAWVIQLMGPSVSSVPPGCVPAGGNPVVPFLGGGSIPLVQSNFYSSNPTALFSLCGTACAMGLNPPPAPTTTSPGILLSGQFVVAANSPPGPIVAVSTTNFPCPVSATMTSSTLCATTPSVFPEYSYVITGTQLPTAVNYVTGQTVAVSVLISFQ